MAAPTSDAPPSSVHAPVGLVLPPGVQPLPPEATPEEKDAFWFKHVYAGDKMPQLTLRAVLLGGILGMAMSASNLYTTLSIGWAFGVAITACVMSYVLWTLLSFISGRMITRAFVVVVWGVLTALLFLKWHSSFTGWFAASAPQWAETIGWGIAGVLFLIVSGLAVLVWFRHSNMSLLENNCMQSTASAAGYSTGSTIATMFGALLLLVMPEPGKTSADVSTWAVQPIWLVAAFTFLTGLMGVFLAIPMKRQMINHEQLAFPSGIAAAETLRSLYSASQEAVRKAYALVIALICGAVVGVLNTDEDTAKSTGFLQQGFDWVKEKLTFGIQLHPEYPTGGLITRNGKELIDSGFQPSVLLLGAGMITGLRVSLSMLAGSVLLYLVVAPRLIDMDTANAAVAGYKPSIEVVAGGTIYHVYRWALWGGTALMVMSSLTSLAMQWRTIARAFIKTKQEAKHHGDVAAIKAIEVPFWWMVVGMIPIAIGMIILQMVAFSISWYAGVIAVALSFVLSLVACRATGETDTTPIGAMGKVMQLTFAALHPGQIVPNLASAGIAANSASSSADLLTDLKSGYLLGANPRKQFLAQFCGVFFGTLAIVPIWYLMVPTKAVLEKFPAPGTQSWYRIAKILTEGITALPMSARWAIGVGLALGMALPIIEKFCVPPKYRKYFPSAMGLGLSWVVPFANAMAFAIGAVIAWIWSLIHSRNADKYNVPIASGLIAGESLVKAALAITATIVGLLTAGSAPTEGTSAAAPTPTPPPAVVQPANPPPK